MVNYELPNVPESYVHRIGRTARAGRSGVAVALCASDEIKLLKDVEKLIGTGIRVDGDAPDHVEDRQDAVPAAEGVQTEAS